MEKYTDDSNLWWEFEHELTSKLTGDVEDDEVVIKYHEELYEFNLNFIRGLDRDALVEWATIVAPDLLKMVEV